MSLLPPPDEGLEDSWRAAHLQSIMFPEEDGFNSISNRTGEPASESEGLRETAKFPSSTSLYVSCHQEVVPRYRADLTASTLRESLQGRSV